MKSKIAIVLTLIVGLFVGFSMKYALSNHQRAAGIRYQNYSDPRYLESLSESIQGEFKVFKENLGLAINPNDPKNFHPDEATPTE